MTDPLDLTTRAGLPDALRVLLEKHPRNIWGSHANFDGLTRFWLERHLMFRRLNGMLIDTARMGIDRSADARAVSGQIHRLASMFLDELHAHHSIEDAHYFPMLARMEPGLDRGFALLDSDHQAIDPMLHGLAQLTNTVLQTLPPARMEMSRLHDALSAFSGFLDRHLSDEEEIVVPVILEHGARMG